MKWGVVGGMTEDEAKKFIEPGYKMLFFGGFNNKNPVLCGIGVLKNYFLNDSGRLGGQ